jgi:8-oxo-dGTP pyrophosphatase MutT (NUDIX family)
MSLPPLLPRLSHALQRIATGPARTIASPSTQPRRASVALLVRIRPHPDDEARLAAEYDGAGMPLAAQAETQGSETGNATVTQAPEARPPSPTASAAGLTESFTSSLAPDSTAQLGASSSSAELLSSSASPSSSSASASSPASASASASLSNATPPSTSITHALASFFSLPWVARGTPEVLYIKRSARIGDKWSAHVALPGGRREESDENGLYTAMRETWEEVGLDLAEREFLSVGQLDDREITTSLGKRLLMVLSPYGEWPLTLRARLRGLRGLRVRGSSPIAVLMLITVAPGGGAVFLQTSPFSPLPELQASEVASAHWIPLSLLYTPTPKWGLTSVDIASRLAPKSPFVRAALRALVGKMDFKCVLLPNAPVATAGEEEEFGNGEKRKEKSVALEEGERPELRLWGLTLGITL